MVRFSLIGGWEGLGSSERSRRRSERVFCPVCASGFHHVLWSFGSVRADWFTRCCYTRQSGFADSLRGGCDGGGTVPERAREAVPQFFHAPLFTGTECVVAASPKGCGEPLKSVKVCTTAGCPNIVSREAPCPVHGRPVNAPWSSDRDLSSHMKLRRQVLQDRGAVCQRCGLMAAPDGVGLQMHHVKPGDQATSVVLLCGPCHKEVDRHARNT